MKVTALFFAASIAVAVAYPARKYYGPVSYDEEEYPGGKNLWAGQPSYELSSAPFYFQARNLEVDESSTGRKYQVVKRKKNPGAPPPPNHQEDEEDDDDDAQDDEEGSSSEEDEDEEADEEESMDVPPWEELFPEEDKNTGSFDDQSGQGGYGGQGGSIGDIPGGGPAPESTGLMSLFTGGSSSSGQSEGGPGGPPQQQGDIGGPSQYRRGPPPPAYQAVRARAGPAEEPRSGGTVLYDGVRYIPVNVRIPKRQAKKIKPTPKKVAVQGRSLIPTTATRRTKKVSGNKKYVVMPVERDSREIRFSRDDDGFRVESGPIYSPTEIWRWERPQTIRRRENRPSGLYYAPRPHRGSSSSVRFAEENDY